jgi:hypothetical protein
LIRSTFEEAATHFGDDSIDLVHLDGCHTYEAASADFALWRPKLNRRGVVLMHDTNVRERDFGAWRLWEELSPQFPSFEFVHGHGLGVLAVGSEMPEPLEWLLSRSTQSADDVLAVREFFACLGGAISERFLASQADRALEAQVGALTAEVAALRQQQLALTQERDQAALAAADATARAGRADEHLAAAGDQLRDRDSALNQKTQSIADLQERLRMETERRARAEAERDRLAQSSFIDRLFSR